MAQALHTTFPERLAFTDLETTNSWPPAGEMIELGLVLVETKTLRVLERQNWKIQPQHLTTANPEVLQMNHYSAETWADAVSPNQALTEYLAITTGTGFCSWRVAYDFTYLHDALNREGLIPPHPFGTEICVYSMALLALRAEVIRPFKLKTVAQFLGLPPEPEPHQAMSGAELAFQVYQSLMTKS